MKRSIGVFFLSLFISLGSLAVVSAEMAQETEQLAVSIESNNTKPTPRTQTKEVSAESWVRDLIESLDEPITNPYLIEQLNQTTIQKPFFSFGSKSNIFLGRWPLDYQTEKTETNWLYQSINENELTDAMPVYFQQETVDVSGGLQVKVDYSDHVQMMMLEDVRSRIDLPVNDQVRFGKETEIDVELEVEHEAVLEAYAGAIKESGILTYGDVYLETKGRQKALVIKNVIEQDIIAWLPINHHVSFQIK